MGIAQAAHREGARLAVTYQGERLLENVQELSQQLRDPLILPCDVVEGRGPEGARRRRSAREFGTLDFVVHAVAFALRGELDGEFVNTSREGYRLAQDISSYSLTALARATMPLMPNGGSIVTLSYLWRRARGTALQRDGRRQGRARDVGPLPRLGPRPQGDPGQRRSRPARSRRWPRRAFTACPKMLKNYHRTHAPLRRNTDQDEVGDTALFLVSPLSRGVTGEVIHVDGGFHVMGMAAL